MLRRFCTAFFVMLIMAFLLHSSVRMVYAEESVPEPTPATASLPALAAPATQEALPDNEMEYFVHFAVYVGETLCREMDTTMTTSRPIQSYDIPKLKEYLLSKVDTSCQSGTIVLRSVVRIPIL